MGRVGRPGGLDSYGEDAGVVVHVLAATDAVGARRHVRTMHAVAPVEVEHVGRVDPGGLAACPYGYGVGDVALGEGM